MALLQSFDLLGGGGDATSAAVRAEFVDDAEQLADHFDDYRLDFTPDSLARLDGFVDGQWDADRFAEATFEGDDSDSRVFSGLVVQLGAYLGEVLVRNHEAVWVDDDDFGAAVRVGGGEADAVVDVFHVAARSLRDVAEFEATYERIERET
jgi:hypothetical protein